MEHRNSAEKLPHQHTGTCACVWAVMLAARQVHRCVCARVCVCVACHVSIEAGEQVCVWPVVLASRQVSVCVLAVMLAARQVHRCVGSFRSPSCDIGGVMSVNPSC